MGACTSTQKKLSRDSTPTLLPKPQEKLPIDTSEIYNFQGSYYVKLVWGHEILTTAPLEGSEIKWPNEWTFNTQAPVSHLQEHYLTAELYQSATGTPLSQLYISLWNITVGPSYQNFALVDFKHRTIGRLGLDVKVLQQTKIEISPLKVKCSFLHEEFGHFSLNLRCAEQSDMETPHSSLSDVAQWQFAKDDFLPETSLKTLLATTIEGLKTASLQFRVWRHKKNEEKSLFGECWIGFSKLLKDDRISALRSQLSRSIAVTKESNNLQIDTILQQKDATIQREFSEKLWMAGRQIGTISVNLVVANIPFITQLIAGVNTEDGILLQSTSFTDSKAKVHSRSKAVLPPAMVEVNNSLEKLKENLNNKPRGIIQIRSTYVKSHISDVEELTKKLKETSKETMISHIYNTELELLEAQQVFLDLGEFLLEFADTVAYEVRGYYFECLSHLIKRGELDLGYISLEREMDSGLKERKIHVGIRYRTFLRKLLVTALAKMNLKGVDQKVQEFSEVVCVLSYFRIPEFKDKLLSALKRKSFEPIAEWRGTNFDLEEEVTVHSESLPMLNWQQFFYTHLPPEEDEGYIHALNEERWQTRMEKRGVAYFRFVSEWATDVKRLFVHKHVPYEDIPGYTVILKSFLIELKARPIEHYPEVLLTASRSLLYNPTLISVFITILFQKTNLYSFEAVMETYSITNNWLTFLYEKGHGLPTSFVHSFFGSALKLTLCDEVALNVANSIWLLLRNYQVLHKEVKREIVLECLLGTQAYRLMFHWSGVIRKLFWSFFFYRIKSLSVVPLEPLTPIDDEIIRKCEELEAALLNAEDCTSEKIAQEMMPYINVSRKEYEERQKEYTDWLHEKEPEAKRDGGTRGKYGPFKDYPFPDVKVEKVFEDEIEKKLEEEW